MHRTDPFFQRLAADTPATQDTAVLSSSSSKAKPHLAPAYSPNAKDTVLQRGASNTPRGALLRDDEAHSDHVVMDPMAALRYCLRYIASHPETYGANLHAVLDREVMHVVRLVASEMALVRSSATVSLSEVIEARTSPSPPPGGGATAAEPLTLPPIPPSRRTEGDVLARSAPLPRVAAVGGGGGGGGEVSGAGFVSSAVLAQRSARRRSRRHHTTSPSPSPGGAARAVGSVFGYGGELTLVEPAAAGFLGLFEATNVRQGAGREGQRRHTGKLTTALPERIDWNESRPTREAVDSAEDPDTTPPLEVDDDDDEEEDETAEAYGSREHAAAGASVAVAVAAATGGGVGALATTIDGGSGHVVREVVDGTGYEVSFLRNQLQQLEAAYNAKCIRLHEVVEENERLTSVVQTSDEATYKWQAAYHKLQAQSETTRRELEGWKEKASQLQQMAQAAALPPAHGGAANAVGGAERSTKELAAVTEPSSSTRQSQNLVNAKEEVTNLTQMWRDAERALQEARRAHENAENEANQSHEHLNDAFQYIERLERRVARRNAYIALSTRRQSSLEEKYEKLMWCFHELGTMTGAHSYVDFLLADDPVWSLVLFTRLQRRVGDYAVEETRAAVNSGTGSESMALVFHQSPGGGRLVDGFYDPQLVYKHMAMEVTAVEGQRVKRLRTNLHGTVGCRVLRYSNRFAVDYLGGEDCKPDSCDLNRRKLPLLTLGQLVLPLFLPNGTRALPTPTTQPEAEGATETTEPLPSGPSTASTATVGMTEADRVVNSGMYDKTTLRYILHCFWRERLGAFRRRMLRRLHRVPTAGTGQTDAFEVGADGTLTRAMSAGRPSSVGRRQRGGDAGNEEGGGEDGEEEDETIENTFLAALFTFAVRLTEESKWGTEFAANANAVNSGATPSPPSAPNATPAAGDAGDGIAVAVRGVPTSRVPAAVAGSAGLWDSGRLFFAAVLHADSRHPCTAPLRSPLSPSGGGAVRDGTGAGNTTLASSSFSLHDSYGTKSRELLAALYYYTMEYKDCDADFRLFYLVSHQLIPEAFAVNFYAGLEAMQRDWAETLHRRLYPSGSDSNRAPTERSRRSFCATAGQTLPDAAPITSKPPTAAAPASPTSRAPQRQRTVSIAPAEEERLADSLPPSRAQLSTAPAEPPPHSGSGPLTALCRVAEIVDKTPLVGETETVEPDSDGEGYGSILAAPVLSVTAVQCRRSVTTSHDADLPSSTFPTPSEGGSSCVAMSAAQRDAALVHNIRQYLKDTAEQRSLARGEAVPAENKTAPAEPGASDENVGDNDTTTMCAVPLPEAWEAVDSEVRAALGPHSSLLRDFDEAARNAAMNGECTLTGPGFFARQRARRMYFDAVQSKQLAAIRGLLPLDEVVALLQRHSFTTYAVAVCGTPRYSLAKPLQKLFANNGRTLEALTPVGRLPPTAVHLQRLRFALALDQPSSLVHCARLFDVDSHTGAMSHLYDELLTVTLDVFEQQQQFWMNALRQACAARHERYAAEGAEDCDGKVPIAYLKKGLNTTFTKQLGLDKAQAGAMVGHLLHYDALLKHEDDVIHEQFTDAPLWLCAEDEYAPDALVQGGGEPTGTSTTPSASADDLFDLREETESVSLLHLALAVRMTLTVWSPGVEAAASRLMQRATTLPLFSSGDTSTSEGTQHRSGLLKRAATAAGSGARVEETDASGSGADCAANAAEKERFVQSVKAAYLSSAQRISRGGGGDTNPLRRTLHDPVSQDSTASPAAPVGGPSASPEQASNAKEKATKGTPTPPPPFAPTPTVGIDGAPSQPSPGEACPLLSGLYPNYTAWLTAVKAAAARTLSSSPTPEPKGGKRKGDAATTKAATTAVGSAALLTRPGSGSAAAAGTLPRTVGAATSADVSAGLLSLARVLGLPTAVHRATVRGAGAEKGAGAAKGKKKAGASKKGGKSAAMAGASGSAGLAPGVQALYDHTLQTSLEQFQQSVEELVKASLAEVAPSERSDGAGLTATRKGKASSQSNRRASFVPSPDTDHDGGEGGKDGGKAQRKSNRKASAASDHCTTAASRRASRAASSTRPGSGAAARGTPTPTWSPTFEEEGAWAGGLRRRASTASSASRQAGTADGAVNPEEDQQAGQLVVSRLYPGCAAMNLI